MSTASKLLFADNRLSILFGALLMATAANRLWSSYANGFIQIFGLTILYAVITDNKVKNKFFLTWVFTTLWLVGSVWWLYIAMHQFGGLHPVLTVVALLLLCGGLASYYTATVYVLISTYRYIPKIGRAWVFAACWTFAELARAQWWTGFPWAAIGYAQVDTSLSLAAPWLGVYGVGFLSAVISALLWEYEGKIKIILIISLAMALYPIINSTLTAEVKDTDISVTLLQGNIKQDEKFNIARQDAVKWYLTELKANESNLVVMPETAIPYIKEELPKEFWTVLRESTELEDKVAIIGIPTKDELKGYGNSAIGIGFNQELQYDKYHLVPFGEFTPNILRWFTRLMNVDFGDFNKGDINQALFHWNGQRMAMTICYEDLFGEDLAVRFKEEENAPTLFVNISNIGWFGDTSVVGQHVDIARMRSLEFKRPTLRATNSGGTAIIAANGEIVSQLSPYVRGKLTGHIPATQKEITFFARWAGKWGLMPLWILTSCVMLSALLIKRFNLFSESVK